MIIMIVIMIIIMIMIIIIIIMIIIMIIIRQKQNPRPPSDGSTRRTNQLLTDKLSTMSTRWSTSMILIYDDHDTMMILI